MISLLVIVGQFGRPMQIDVTPRLVLRKCVLKAEGGFKLWRSVPVRCFTMLSMNDFVPLRKLYMCRVMQVCFCSKGLEGRFRFQYKHFRLCPVHEQRTSSLAFFI